MNGDTIGLSRVLPKDTGRAELTRQHRKSDNLIIFSHPLLYAAFFLFICGCPQFEEPGHGLRSSFEFVTYELMWELNVSSGISQGCRQPLDFFL